MATSLAIETRRRTPQRTSPCEFVQALMKLQRAAQLITSTLDLDLLIDRVVNDLAASIGCVEVCVWLRDPHSDEMVLHGVRGCTIYARGNRLKIGHQGMVGHVASTGRMRYAADVRVDPYYIPCEPATRSEVTVPLLIGGEAIGVLCIDHLQTNAFSRDQLSVFQALAGHIAVAIENARLFQRERSAREQMQREADEARAIQQGLFSEIISAHPGLCLRDRLAPCRSGRRRLVRLHRPWRWPSRHRPGRRVRKGDLGRAAHVIDPRDHAIAGASL